MLERYLAVPVTDPVFIFALLMLTALVAPLLSDRFKLPGIIGLILAGVILGPHGLGILARGDEVELLGKVGLLYIMFLAGLELDLAQFLQHKHHSAIFGGFTFGIPLVLGTLMGKYLLGFSWPASILLSSMFSSHTLITYPIASRLGLNRQRAVTTTIGGTLITDTAALLVLAIIAALHQGGGSFFFWVKMLKFMAVYVAAVIIILPRVGRWFFRNIASEGIVAFTGVIAAVFFSAYMAHLAGFEPIIGAFLAGLMLNSLIPENGTLMNRVQFVGHSIFIPIFLISVGMLVNIGLLVAEERTVIIALSMVTAGIVTKYFAADITRRIMDYTPDEGKLIFGLSVNQADATMAAVLVGYNIGIFEEPVLTGTVVMILVTSLLGSWLTAKYARNVALEEEARPYSPEDAPHRVLIPLANPESAEELMNLAMFIRKKDSHEPLYPLSVVESADNTEERIADAEKLLGNAVVRAISADIPVVPITRSAAKITSGIQQAMTDMRISTVILGWKGEVPSAHQTLGHIHDIIIENSRQMIMVSRCSRTLNTVNRVVLAIPPLSERQEGFETAVRIIKTLTQQLSAPLVILSVADTIKSVLGIIKESTPRIPVDSVELEKWGDTMSWFDKSISNEDDLVILFSVRKGKLAWQPSLSKMPRRVGNQLKNINFIVVYPPEKPWRISVAKQKEAEISCLNLLPPRHIHLDLKDGIEEAILQLLKSAFPGKEEQARKLAANLKDMAETEPMELTPGVVLLHAHVSDVNMSTAFLGTSRDGWKMADTTKDVHALFLLLSPRDASPEMHLHALSELIGPLRQEGAPQKIIDAELVAEVIDIIACK